MLYNILKILHIISATFVLTSIAYSYHLWRSMQPVDSSYHIQNQTTFFIIPFALLQLATGFTMISLQHYNFSQWWIGGSVLSFLVAIASWFGFIYFLLLSQQVTVTQDNNSRPKRYHRIQSLMLLFCALGLLSMVFFMANKTVLSQG